MAESTEVQLEELSGSALKHWANPTIESFEIKDARFLLLDLKPIPFDRRIQALPSHVQDTERRLREWLSQNGHTGLLDRVETTYKGRNDWIARGTSLENEAMPVKKAIPAKPIPRNVLKEAAEAMGLRPKFLFPVQDDELESSSGWPWGNHETELLRHLAEAAKRFWVNYDPADSSTAPTNEQVSKWLEERGVPNRKAEVMAQILRADGLPNGPRK